MINTTILNQDPVLAEIVHRFIRDFSPTHVYLFGSRARGDAKESSDYDILLVVSTSDVPGYRLAQKAHRYTLQGIPAPVDVVIITEKVFQAKKNVIGTLSETAIHEGKELYAA
jgi:predicted nucleotidyltransferase